MPFVMDRSIFQSVGLASVSTKFAKMKFSWIYLTYSFFEIRAIYTDRLRAKKGPAPPPPPPLGNFADISYLEENFKPHLLRDVCTLCSMALVSDSLLHMLL